MRWDWGCIFRFTHVARCIRKSRLHDLCCFFACNTFSQLNLLWGGSLHRWLSKTLWLGALCLFGLSLCFLFSFSFRPLEPFDGILCLYGFGGSLFFCNLFCLGLPFCLFFRDSLLTSLFFCNSLLLCTLSCFLICQLLGLLNFSLLFGHQSFGSCLGISFTGCMLLGSLSLLHSLLDLQ